MVTRTSKNFAVSLLIAAVTVVSAGCSVRSWWGEKPRPPEKIVASQSGDGCPEGALILDTVTDEESAAALECWATKLTDAWKQVEGKQRYALSELEIGTLVRRGVLKVNGDKENMIRRILTAKKLMGFGSYVTKGRFDDWISWARTHRPELRRLYRVFHGGREGSVRIRYSDIESLLQIAASALERMNLRLQTEEAADMVLTLLDVQDRDLRMAAEPAAEVGINALNMLCPTFSSPNIWNFRAISNCIHMAGEHFRPGAAWIEFLVNPVNDISSQDIVAIKKSMGALSAQVKSWFSQPNLSPLLTSRLIDLSRRLGAKPPENLFESLRVLRKFGGESTEEAIYPEAMRYLFDIAMQTQMPILDGIEHFVNAVKAHKCRDPETKYWTACVLPDLDSAAKESPAIDLALRVKNVKHGLTASPLNGETFSRLMFLHAISSKIIDVFDDLDNNRRDYLICTDYDNEHDELVQVISVGVAAGDTVSRFFDNISKKLRGIKIPDDSPLNLSRWDARGFARLVTMTNEILVRRTPDEHNVIEGLLSNLNLFPGSHKLCFDQLAFTAVLATIDSLPDYRRSYLHPVSPEAPTKIPHANAYQIELVAEPGTEDFLVERTSLVKNLPKILQAQFPRTYEGCTRFGFDKSCGVAFDELLPAAPAGSRYIHANDLDILTIVAISMEGVIDSCDRNGDGKLFSDFFDGNDELDCGYTRVKDIVQRLIESHIINIKSSDARRANLLINTMNSLFFTRILGKVALSRGTTKAMVLNLPLSLYYWSANIGSMYGLVADVMNPDRARAIADGDELVPRGDPIPSAAQLEAP